MAMRMHATLLTDFFPFLFLRCLHHLSNNVVAKTGFYDSQGTIEAIFNISSFSLILTFFTLKSRISFSRIDKVGSFL